MLTSIINTPSMNAVKAKVDIYNGDILATSCTCSDVLEDFTISREGDTSKFFGFGVCQKLDVNFIDLFRNLTADKINLDFKVKVHFGDGESFDKPYPDFYIKELNRDEKTNTITCTAYDRLYNSSERLFSELGINTPYTIKQLAEACSELLGVTLKTVNVDDAVFDTLYNTGGNFEPADNIRYVLNAIAEATQTIYYLDNNDGLVFKRLDKDGESVFTITKDSYYELSTKTSKTLTGICSATELGDNVQTKGDSNGVVQYVRDNPLWDLRTDIDTLLDNAIAAVNGLSITQYECDWSGNYLLEIGDKLSLVAEDNNELSTYLICDVIEYAGTLSEVSRWEYSEQGSETATNPTSLGDALNLTFARVDKANKNITLLVSDVNATNDAFIKNNEQTYNELQQLKEQVSLAITKDEVSIDVLKEISDNGGANKVVTANTRYTFDENGLRISKSDKEISTEITEDGMSIYKNDNEVLVANNKGVKAIDLHASTYLIIGENSRFEDYNFGTGIRTGCFWIGG